MSERKKVPLPFDEFLNAEKEVASLRIKVDNLEAEKEALEHDVEYWKEKYENEVQYREDNFERVSKISMYGLRESDF